MLVVGSFDPSALPTIAASWPAIVLAVGGTLGVSVLAGLGLSRVTSVDRATATLGTLPGGAPAMIAMSLELGANTPAVASMQYVRIVVAVLSASLVGRLAIAVGAPAPVADPGTAAASGSGASRVAAGDAAEIATIANWLAPGLPDTATLAAYAATATIAAGGVALGSRLPIPAGVLLGPLVIGVAASELVGLPPRWPPAVPELAYILLGLYVGAMFDTTALRAIRRQLPAMFASILALIALCAILGTLLAALTGADLLTGILATTPGGLDSVIAIGLTTGADVSLMLSVQMARLFAVLLLAPPLARWLLRTGGAT